MENIYVKCIEQILKVEPPVEEARELIMRVVKQELQYSDKLTESQKSKAIELLSLMQFPLKIKRELSISNVWRCIMPVCPPLGLAFWQVS